MLVFSSPRRVEVAAHRSHVLYRHRLIAGQVGGRGSERQRVVARPAAANKEYTDLLLPDRVFDQHRNYAINVRLIRQNACDEEEGLKKMTDVVGRKQS